MSLHIAISLGDINGIGPEVVLKMLSDGYPEDTTPVILGSVQAVNYYRDLLNIDLDYHPVDDSMNLKKNKVNVLDPDNANYAPQPGELRRESGKMAMQAVELGIDLCNSGRADALVTAPISKESVNRAGYDIPGHTEFLAEKTACENYMMMLVNDSLRVGLASIHVPLARASSLVTEELLLRKLDTMNQSLKKDFGITHPKIAVLGLNPHAGDGGIIGSEEIETINPALEKAQSRNIQAGGPFAADGFFGNRKYIQYDGILAMYHDQGLIPFKTLSFGTGVNFTAGLPIIRTSPDHGTAFDIAGKNRADTSSFAEAYKLAVKLARNRQEQIAHEG